MVLTYSLLYPTIIKEHSILATQVLRLIVVQCLSYMNSAYPLYSFPTTNAIYANRV